jgi:hypothetical protein
LDIRGSTAVRYLKVNLIARAFLLNVAFATLGAGVTSVVMSLLWLF